MVQGGHNRKTVEELKVSGSYRPGSRHKGWEELEAEFVPLCSKPVFNRKTGAPKKWIKNRSDELALESGCWFETRAGKYAVDWIESNLTITEGEKSGEPFKLIPWQKDVVMRLFGWLRWDDDRDRAVRRFDRAFVFIPKKNGKTPLSAAIAMYMMLGDSNSLGNNAFIAAVDRNQGAIAGQHVARMIEANEQLSIQTQLNKSDQFLRALYTPTQSTLRTLPGTPERLEGINGVCLVMDELHAWKGDKSFAALRFFAASRPEPITFIITTAGDDLESVCRKQYDYAKSVSEGTVVDQGYFSVIYEADEKISWRTERAWKKANPALGHILTLREMAASAKEAESSIRSQMALERYRLNRWKTGSAPWLDPDRWEACYEPFDNRDLEGATAIGGLDLARVLDTTAFALQFYDEESDVFRQLVRFWLPETTAINRAHLASYQQWQADGVLVLTPGDVCDYDVVFEGIAELADQFNIAAIAFDPWHSETVRQRIEKELAIECIKFGQSPSNIEPAADEYERRIIEGSLRHNGNALLSWQARHVTTRHGKKFPTKPSKTAGDYRTIDGIVAGVMALGLSQVFKPKRRKFDLYEKKRVRQI